MGLTNIFPKYMCPFSLLFQHIRPSGPISTLQSCQIKIPEEEEEIRMKGRKFPGLPRTLVIRVERSWSIPWLPKEGS